jgi:hypothetical protein
MKRLFKHNGKAYVIHRSIPVSFFTDKKGMIDSDEIKEWRDYLPFVNHVLKNETHYLFAETIEDVNTIEENIENVVE